MVDRFKKSIFIFFVGSFLLHFVSYLSLDSIETHHPESTAIEVSLVDQKPTPDSAKINGQIVDQKDKAINEEIPEKTKFLSAQNQTVKKQTVAQKHGEFKNAQSDSTSDSQSGSMNRNPLDRFKPTFNLTQMVQERLESDLAIEKRLETEALVKQNDSPKKQAAQQNGGAGSPGSSQTLDYIKNIDPGLETLLSTKEFVFFSYFSRIREQLNQHWSPRVKEKVDQIYKQGRAIASTDDKITKCLVTLDKNGKLIKIQIIGDSGLRELDEAAVEAFRAAAPFPNPPKGMVDDDGTIKIRWDFILEA